MKLFMMKGLPASGKTTRAKEMCRNLGIKRVNKDDLRAMIDDGQWSADNEAMILRFRDAIIAETLTKGLDIVVDDTNLIPKHEQDLRQLAEKHGALFGVIDLTSVPLEICLRRDRARAKPVGDDVIKNMHRRWLSPAKQPKAVEEPKAVPYDASLPDCIIVDIDGTVALHGTERTPYEWNKVSGDKVNEPVAKIVQLQASSFATLNGFEATSNFRRKIFFVSGRSAICREQTLYWLNSNLHTWTDNELLMRAVGDNRDDAIVKREIYEAHIKGKYNVLYVLDDRNKVVKMWREQGLTCLQVAEGNF